MMSRAVITPSILVIHSRIDGIPSSGSFVEAISRRSGWPRTTSKADIIQILSFDVGNSRVVVCHRMNRHVALKVVVGVGVAGYPDLGKEQRERDGADTGESVEHVEQLTTDTAMGSARNPNHTHPTCHTTTITTTNSTVAPSFSSRLILLPLGQR